eukprot:3910634-Amphidinium_carterae.1
MGATCTHQLRPDRGRQSPAQWNRTLERDLLAAITAALHSGVCATMTWGSLPQFSADMEMHSTHRVEGAFFWGVTLACCATIVAWATCRSHFCPAGARVAQTRAGRVAKLMSRWQERGDQGWYKKPTRRGGRENRPFMQGYGATLQGVDSRGRSLAAISRAAQQKEKHEWRRKQQADAEQWRRQSQAGREAKGEESADSLEDGQDWQARSRSPPSHANRTADSAAPAASSQQQASAPASRPEERIRAPQEQSSSLIPSCELLPAHKLPPYFGPRIATKVAQKLDGSGYICLLCEYKIGKAGRGTGNYSTLKPNSA